MSQAEVLLRFVRIRAAADRPAITEWELSLEEALQLADALRDAAMSDVTEPS